MGNPRRESFSDETAKLARRINVRYRVLVLEPRRKKIEGVIEFGQFLNREKDRLGHGQWGKLFTAGVLDVDQDTARMHMAIAEHKVLSNSDNYRNLPDAVSTLHELAQLPEDVLTAAIQSGRVKATMTRAEAKALLALQKPESATRSILRGLAFVNRFTAPKDTMPALKHIFIEKGTANAFSGSAGATWPIPWEIEDSREEAGTLMAIPGGDFAYDLSSVLDLGHEAAIDLKVTETHLTYKAGTLQGQWPLLPPEEYVLPGGDVQVVRTVPADQFDLAPDFWTDLAKVEPAITKDETKQLFRGVYWAENGAFVATDTFRVTLAYPGETRTRCPRKGGVLIPDSFLQMLGAERTRFSKVAFEEDEIWFCDGQRAAYGQLIHGEFPATKVLALIKATRETAATEGSGTTVVIRSDAPFVKAVNHLLYHTRAPRHCLRVDVTGDAVRLAVEVEHKDVVTAEVTVEVTAEITLQEVQVSGPPVTFYVNGKMFQEALGISERFWFAPGKPIYFHNEAKRVEHLLLPITITPPAEDPLGSRAAGDKADCTREDGPGMDSPCPLGFGMAAKDEARLSVEPSIHFHSSEDMSEVADHSAKLLLGASVYRGPKAKWEEYMKLYKKVYIDEGQRILREDGYLVVLQTDAYRDGGVEPKNCLLPLALIDAGYKLLDVKIWKRRAADLYQVPFSVVTIYTRGRAKRPPATFNEYFQGIWDYPQTKGGEINGWPDRLCRLLIEAFTEEGDLIVDPFAGTGRLLGMAARMKRQVVGYEINKALRPTIEANMMKTDEPLAGSPR